MPTPRPTRRVVAALALVAAFAWGASCALAGELRGGPDHEDLVVPLPADWLPAATDELQVHRALDAFLDASVLGEGRSRLGVIVLTLTPYHPDDDGDGGVAIGGGVSGLRAHLQASVDALDGVEGVRVVSSEIVAEPDDAAPVAQLIIERTDSALARDLGIAAPSVTQITTLTPASSGLVQVFAYVSSEQPALVEALANHFRQHLRLEGRPGRAPQTKEGGSSLLIIVLVIAIGLIVLLRLYMLSRQRHLRARATSGSLARPVTKLGDSELRETPRAPWEDELAATSSAQEDGDHEPPADGHRRVDPADGDA